MDEKRFKNIEDTNKCWICNRNNKDLKKAMPNFDKEQDGIRWAEMTNRSWYICGICEDLIMGVSITTYNELREEDSV